jgi:hypothetical protein
MVEVACKKCGGVIPADSINEAAGVAYCTGCGEAFGLAELRGTVPEWARGGDDVRPLERADLVNAPAGCRVSDHGTEVFLRVSTRSVAGAIAVGFFAAFWNGIVGVFVVLVLGTTLVKLQWLPAWVVQKWPALTAPGSNSFKGMPTPMLIFIWIFLIPFVFVGLMLLTACVRAIMGSLEVVVSRGPGEIEVRWFAGPLRAKTKRYASEDVRGVWLERPEPDSDGDRGPEAIVIKARNEWRITDNLPEERRVWLASALAQVLGVEGMRVEKQRHVPRLEDLNLPPWAEKWLKGRLTKK